MKIMKKNDNQNSRLLLIMILFLITASATVFGQTKTAVHGTVSDVNGVALPGANVVVKGSSVGTTTDFDGNYTIITDTNATLIFSYIGMLSQ